MVPIVADMLLALLSVCSEEELSEPSSEPGTSAEDIQRRRDEIKRKIRAVGKMQRVYQILRLVLFSFTTRFLVHDCSCLFLTSEGSENATELDIHAATPGSDALGVSGSQIGRAIRTFDEAYVYPVLHL